MGGNFSKNKFLYGIYKFICGITFINLQDRQVLGRVFEIFIQFYKAPECKKFKKKFKNFIKYLVNNFLKGTAKFPHSKWNYYEALSDSDFSLTTNSLENLNLKLKKIVGTGYLSKGNAFRKIKQFHMDCITLYTGSVVQNQMPKIKARTLRREATLLERLYVFHDLL